LSLCRRRIQFFRLFRCQRYVVRWFVDTMVGGCGSSLFLKTKLTASQRLKFEKQVSLLFVAGATFQA
jgi:hypothetical protein